MLILSQILINRKDSFNNTKEDAEVNLCDSSYCDISFIVPVRGRQEFLPILYDAFKISKDNVNKKIELTVVEHSHEKSHMNFCVDNEINYIFIPCEEDELFNKCLAMNCGVLLSNDADYFLFHDLDCIMQSNFFSNIMLNLEEKKVEALQTFTKRRVLYCSAGLTQKIIEGGYDYDSLEFNGTNVTLPNTSGASGGSIFIKKELFFKIGGYDHLLFQANSPEEAFFWKKIETLSKIEVCDNPENELFHLSHPITYKSNPRNKEMKEYYQQFLDKNQQQRENLIKLMARQFNQWKNR